MKLDTKQFEGGVPQRATVGRQVHFYNGALPDHANNGTGKGPYPATVLQAFGDKYINLKVLAWGVGNWDEGSVSALADVGDQGRYWVWPPRA